GQVISELAKTGTLRRVIPKEYEIARWMANHRDLPVAEYNEMLRTRWFWSGREDMPGPNPYASDGTIARGVSWIYDGYAVAVHRNDFYFERRVALIPRPLIYAAAADHCLGAAYRGECPGVDPDELMRWRAESRAKFQGRSVEEVLADVERAQAALRAAPSMYLEPPYDIDRFGQPSDWSGYPAVGSEGGVEVRDMRQPVDQRPTRELPQAAARPGIGYVSGPLAGPDGKQKTTRSWTADQHRAFLDYWTHTQ